MSSMAIVPTGTANTASVMAAISRLGFRPVLTGDPATVLRSEHVVLPGVGTFAASTAAIDQQGLRSALSDRINQGRPTLAICVGMQILAGASDESPGTSGLGLIEGRSARFSGEAGVPQLGWNLVSPGPGLRFVQPGWAYFANSYRLTTIPNGWLGAITDHGGPFVSAIERGDVLACQFHPELSGSWGAQMLSRWMNLTGAAN